MASPKPKKDPRGGHVRVYWDIVDSMAWRALSWADQGLYIAMRRKLGSTNNGNIEATLGGASGGLRHYGITSSASLAKGLRALMTVGLIAKTRSGRMTHQGKKECNLFRFTDEPVFDMPKLGIKAIRATNEWRAFHTLAGAKAAIEAAHAAARTGKKPGARNAKTVQKLNATSSEIESGPDSEIEHRHLSRVQKLNMAGAAMAGVSACQDSSSSIN